jgi:60S ribosome subunit biogenesis protein NIP7
VFFHVACPSPPQYKVWVKPAAEQSFLYGNNILKSGLARMTENTPQYQGVVIFNMHDIPLVRRPRQCEKIIGCPFSLYFASPQISPLLKIQCPQGFGATASSTQSCRVLDPAAVVVFHQADIGEVSPFFSLCGDVSS